MHVTAAHVFRRYLRKIGRNFHTAQYRRVEKIQKESANDTSRCNMSEGTGVRRDA